MSDKLILASGSPRRRELLSSMGYDFEVIVSEAEEMKSGDPELLVTENAYLKAAAVAKSHPGRWVIGSDTLVFSDGEPLGKPRDAEDAARMLHALSGNTHAVYTGIALMKDETVLKCCDRTEVTFETLTDEEIRRYIASGEPMDKAGAYAIQGLGNVYVKRICGNYSNVIGLNTCLMKAMLEKAGVSRD